MMKAVRRKSVRRAEKFEISSSLIFSLRIGDNLNVSEETDDYEGFIPGIIYSKLKEKKCSGR